MTVQPLVNHSTDWPDKKVINNKKFPSQVHLRKMTVVPQTRNISKATRCYLETDMDT